MRTDPHGTGGAPGESTSHSGAPRHVDHPRRRRYLQIAFGLVSLVIAVIVLGLLRDLLGAFVLGATIAFLIQPAVLRLEALGLPRIAAIVSIFIVILALFAGVIGLFVPFGIHEVSSLQSQVPKLASAAQDRLNSLQGSPVNLMGLSLDLTDLTATINSRARDFILGQFANAVGIGIAAVNTILQVVLMFVVAFLLAVDAPRVTALARRLVPNDYRNDFDQIWRRIRRMLYAYMRGQLAVAALIGVLCGVSCALIGLPDAIALGLIAGLTSLIPYLGPLLGALPAVLVGLAASPTQALLIAIAYVIISNVILNVVYPKLIGDAVRLSPLLVIVAFIAGFSWGGILGMFVAIPIAAVLRILFDHIYPRLYEAPA